MTERQTRRSACDVRPEGTARVRAPGSGQGVEQVLLLAASDEAFREALRRDRPTALAARGFRLTPSEQALLHAVSDEQLEGAARGLRAPSAQVQRRTFLRAVALSSATLVAGRGLNACESPASASAVRRVSARAVGLPLSFRDRATVPLTLGSPSDARIVGFSLRVDLRARLGAGLFRVAVVSPLGTRVRLLSGAAGPGRHAGGVRGWFGDNAYETAESVARLHGEPLTGIWQVEMQVPGEGTLLDLKIFGGVKPAHLSQGAGGDGNSSSDLSRETSTGSDISRDQSGKADASRDGKADAFDPNWAVAGCSCDLPGE